MGYLEIYYSSATYYVDPSPNRALQLNRWLYSAQHIEKGDVYMTGHTIFAVTDIIALRFSDRDFVRSYLSYYNFSLGPTAPQYPLYVPSYTPPRVYSSSDVYVSYPNWVVQMWGQNATGRYAVNVIEEKTPPSSAKYGEFSFWYFKSTVHGDTVYTLKKQFKNADSQSVPDYLSPVIASTYESPEIAAGKLAAYGSRMAADEFLNAISFEFFDERAGVEGKTPYIEWRSVFYLRYETHAGTTTRYPFVPATFGTINPELAVTGTAVSIAGTLYAVEAPPPQQYTITVERVSGGSVSVDKSTASEGERVTITVTPQSGMELSHLYVLSGIDSVPVHDSDNGTKYFTMPAADVVIRAVFEGNPIPVEPSEPGGGGGEAGDLPPGVISIPVPTYPASHALSTGFITGWKVDDSQLANLHTFLFGESFADSIKQVLASPMDSIVSLSMLPMSTLPVSSARVITLGNVSSTVSATPLSSQFMTVPCGTVRYPIYFGTYLDFAPYTKVSVFLPYIGTRELNADLIVGKDVSITYNVDLLTGACVAIVGTQDSSGETMIGYHFNGNCLMHVPLTGRDVSGQIMSVFDTFSRIGAAAITGNPMPLVSALPQIAGRAAVLGGATVAGGYSGALQGGDIANVIAGKPSFSVSGDVSGSAGFMDVQKPYLIISRPKLNMPANYEQVEGFPLNVWKTFSELTGYTRVAKCVLTDMGCTDAELDEIYRLLTSGVIF